MPPASPTDAPRATGSSPAAPPIDEVGADTRTAPRAPGRRAAPGRRRDTTTARTANRWTLVVPALLVVALVLLVVGLATSASVWLAASLVASVLAAVLLVVERLVQRRSSARDSAPSGVADPVASADADPEPAPPIDLDAPAIDPDDPDAVWVVDGRPRYHLRDCATLTSLAAEPVPRAQALEDGFVACSLCEPTA